jgi:hypothetical protein
VFSFQHPVNKPLTLNMALARISRLMKIRYFVLLLTAVCALNALAVPEMEKLKSIYQGELTRLKAEAQGERLRLPQEHIAAMRELELMYQNDGELKPLLAVRGERERFISDPSVSAITPVSSPERLRSLQLAYIKRYSGLARERETKLKELKDRYLQALEKLQKDLTRQGSIESALAVMNERESHESGADEDASESAATVPLATAAVTPRSTTLDINALNTLLHGEVVRWNSHTRQITISYDFSDAQQMEDWKGGRMDAVRGMLVCDRTVAWMRPQMLKVVEVEYDALLDGDEDSAGMVVGNSLQAHLIARTGIVEAKLFQTSEEHPLNRFTESRGPSVSVHHSVLTIEDNSIDWAVDQGRSRKALLQVPIPYPTYVGFGHMGSVSAYDNITVTGVLSNEYEAYLRQQL